MTDEPIRIRTFEELEKAAAEKRSVFRPITNGLLQKPKPAAVVANFNGGLIRVCLNDPGLFIYTPKSSKK